MRGLSISWYGSGEKGHRPHVRCTSAAHYTGTRQGLRQPFAAGVERERGDRKPCLQAGSRRAALLFQDFLAECKCVKLACPFLPAHSYVHILLLFLSLSRMVHRFLAYFLPVPT